MSTAGSAATAPGRLSTRRLAAMLCLICLLPGVASCRIDSGQQATPGRTITETATPSVLVTVVSGRSAGDLGQALARLTAATARPGEVFDLLRTGARPTVLAAPDSPPASRVAVPGQPPRPGPGATPFQEARYRHLLQLWRDAVTTAKREVAARTRAAMSNWASGLHIAARLSQLPPAGGPGGRLSAECAIGASALGSLVTTAAHEPGDRRVVLLYPTSLDGTVPPGELTGDDVIVVVPFLPSVPALTAAQASLLNAGAAEASILGPQTTSAQLAQLVSSGLDQEVGTEIVSGPALFGNDSAVLLPGAVRLLTPLLGALHKPGTVAVVNGYASTPGSAATNYRLSYARAAAVVSFLEAHGTAASSLVAAGHGAHDLVGPGASAANRRVVVVIESAPSAG